ncbi:Transposable element Hobo transposase [Frankliniella fusca]|uniref:Transposable element Hobo transposase n=1 Tax=Frankliniella fusca TaxID=407009 RepID=A0AAE1HX59_9NEOP|nr:Transposable element Hobo transposase [Frankliniella fusca]
MFATVFRTSTTSRHACVKREVERREEQGNAGNGVVRSLDVPLSAPSTSVKKEVLRSSVLYCAKDMAPFQSVNGEGFVELVQKLLDIGYQAAGRIDASLLMPNRTTVSRKLEDLAGEVKLKFVPMVQKAIDNNTCAASTDMWTQENTKHHFLTVIVHTTNSMGKLDTRTAFTILFDEDCASGENIWAQIVIQFALLGIEEAAVRKIVIVSDRGANMISALQDVQRLDCIAHTINTVLKTALTLKKYEITALNEEAMGIVNKVKQILLFVNSKLPRKIKKFTITKTARVGATQPSHAPMLSQFLNRRKEIKRRLVLAQKMEEYFFDDQFSERVRDLFKILNPLKTLMTRHKGVDLAGSLWPEFQTLTKMSATDSPMVAALKAQWREQLVPLEYAFVHQQCKSLVTYVKNSSFHSALKSTLKQEMDVRWNTSLAMFQSIHAVYDELTTILTDRKESDRLSNIKKDTLEAFIALLDPFKTESIKLQSESEPTLQLVLLCRVTLLDHCRTPTPPEQPLIERLKSRIVNQMDRIFVHSEIRRLYLQQEQAAPGPPPAKRAKISEAYSKYLEDETDQWDLDDELDKYFKEPIIDDTDLIGWWRQRRERFPSLAALALHLLNIPATSASSEREFSEAGHIYREKRLSLFPAATSNILFLHSNADLLEVEGAADALT